MTREQLEAKKADLERKLEARERAGIGYAQNCAAIRVELARINNELNAV